MYAYYMVKHGQGVDMNQSAAPKRPIYGAAVAIAEELDVVRECYGNECVSFVKRALMASADPEWLNVLAGAIQEWSREHPRYPLDLNA